MADRFETFSDSASLPARDAFTIMPHATNPIEPLPKAIFVGTGGQITLRAADSTGDVVLTNVASGTILDIRARFVRATGTTATDIVGLA